MSIRMIAKDLYRLEKDVEHLEEALGKSPPDKRPVLEKKLRKVRAERDRVRAMLEGSKEDPPYRKPL